MHEYDTPLPDDLAAPRRERPKGSDLAGIITGGAMLLVVAGLLVYAVSIYG